MTAKQFEDSREMAHCIYQIFVEVSNDLNPLLKEWVLLNKDYVVCLETIHCITLSGHKPTKEIKGPKLAYVKLSSI